MQHEACLCTANRHVEQAGAIPGIQQERAVIFHTIKYHGVDLGALSRMNCAEANSTLLIAREAVLEGRQFVSVGLFSGRILHEYKCQKLQVTKQV